MNHKTAIVTGATALAATAALLGAAPAAAAPAGNTKAGSFSIEAVAVPEGQGQAGPDIIMCCSLFSWAC